MPSSKPCCSWRRHAPTERPDLTCTHDALAPYGRESLQNAADAPDPPASPAADAQACRDHGPDRSGFQRLDRNGDGRRNIARRRPDSIIALAATPGVGDRKLEAYGQDSLTLLAED